MSTSSRRKWRTSTHPQNAPSRRDIAKLLGVTSALPFVGGLPALWPLSNPTAQAASSTPHKFLQIFLGGGWDSILATDPCLAGSSKAASGGFQSAYHDDTDSQYPGDPATVAGKSNLIVGPGLVPALNAFALAPTAFVNGVFVEVTAHELAVNYLLSGQLSLSRSREFPAFIATMADQTGGFPAHVVLGGGIPLGNTAKSSPPLQSPSVNTFARMLAGPYEKNEDGSGFKEESLDAAHTLIAKLDANFQKRIGKAGRDSLSTWDTAREGLGLLYDKRFGDRLKLSEQIKVDFGISANEEDSPQAQMAMALNVLKEGVSRFVTVNFNRFDTHQQHLANHLPALLQTATALNTLISYLASTNDPDSPSKKLLETTTVLISSEFVRTPLFNGAAGTDHWQSGSVILMGKGISDNTVVGATDSLGYAANYGGDKLLPDHLAASLLRHLGFGAEADRISEVHLHDLFA